MRLLPDSGDSLKPCPFCAERIQNAAILCRYCGRTLPVHQPGVAFRGAELALGFGAFCLVGALLFAGLGGAPGMAERFPLIGDMARSFVQPTLNPAAPEPEPVQPPPPPPPLVVSVLDNPALRLPPGEHFDTAFVVYDEHARPCTFHGRVQGLEGGQRDIEVYLLDEDGHVNWHNGIEPTPLYASGRSAASTIELPLGQGKFHLLISNRYSIFTAKTVEIENAHVVCG